MRLPARSTALGFTLLALAGLQMWGLALLPYSSSLVSGADAREAQAAPSADFRLQELHWPVELYARAPELEVFRREFNRSCAGQRGYDAASCVSQVLAWTFSHGQPSSEFLSARFDPADHLARHLRGEPGHCLTRSAILAAELLSVGIPARVVQIVPEHGGGHTVVEVWQEAPGWRLVDAMVGRVIPVSAVDLVESRQPIGWSRTRSDKVPSPFIAGVAFDGSQRHLVYPEPWLYLRTGPRAAVWPFRGRFVHVGPRNVKFGPVQDLLRLGAPLCLGMAGLLFAAALRRQVRSPVRRHAADPVIAA